MRASPWNGDRHFPNRYAAYLQTGGFSDAKKALELSGILRNGLVVDPTTGSRSKGTSWPPPIRSTNKPIVRDYGQETCFENDSDKF